MKISDILEQKIHETLPPMDDIGHARSKPKKDNLTKVATFIGPNAADWNQFTNRFAVEMQKRGAGEKDHDV